MMQVPILLAGPNSGKDYSDNRDVLYRLMCQYPARRNGGAERTLFVRRMYDPSVKEGSMMMRTSDAIFITTLEGKLLRYDQRL